MATPKDTSHIFNIIRMLHIISHQADEVFDKLLCDEFGLTFARFRILVPLIEIGPQTQADVARFNFLTEASIARQIKLLENEGFVKRVPDKTDGRKFLLTYTKKTEALLPRIKSRLRAEMEVMYQDFSPKERELIHGLLIRLRAAGVDSSRTDAVLCANS
jgi:DNA-binding MarR family transcriptional regulator